MEEFDTSQRHEVYGCVEGQEAADKKIKEMEAQFGLSDMHIKVHLNETQEVVFRDFILCAVNDKGDILFTAHNKAGARTTLYMLMKNVTSSLHLLVQLVQAMPLDENDQKAVDALTEQLERIFREGKMGKG